MPVAPLTKVWRKSPPCASSIGVLGAKVQARNAMDSLRPDCRRFICDLCGTPCYLCSWCDRGQRYCSDLCRSSARGRSLREAGARYQKTPRGRLKHARRQARYRARRSSRNKKVTHQGCPADSLGAKVQVWRKKHSKSRSQGPYLVCIECGHLCEPFVRVDFLRVRRPRV